MASVKQRKNNFDWLQEYKWQKGQSGNPKGRPKTKTLKEFAREYLANMSEESRIAYFQGMKKEEVWKMAEGNPTNTLAGDIDKPLILQLSNAVAKKNGLNDSTGNDSP